MPFCPKCGRTANDGDLFCFSCGTKIPEEQSCFASRKTVFESTILRCQKCGEMIGNDDKYCPSCGFFFNHEKKEPSVKDLIQKLQGVELGRSNSPVSNWMREAGLDSRDTYKANLISNFIIPNNIDEYLEFMILASSSIKIQSLRPMDRVEKAWLSKMEQIYTIAESSYASDPKFEKLKEIYTQKMKSVRKSNLIRVVTIFGLLGVLVVMMIVMLFVTVDSFKSWFN